MAISPEDIRQFTDDGYVVVRFPGTELLGEIQKILLPLFPAHPTDWHQTTCSPEEHRAMATRVNEALAQTDLITRLAQSNQSDFAALLGPDLDIQRKPHFRLSRPEQELDTVAWHRDTFYGNTPWEINLWVPIFPLAPGAGLMFLRGSHLVGPVSVRPVPAKEAERNALRRPTEENLWGFPYAAKTDDTIAGMKPEDVRLITPAFGEGVLFFGCGAHRAQNRSTRTRLTADVRVRNPHTQTHTKAGYYVPMIRGAVERCVERYLRS